MWPNWVEFQPNLPASRPILDEFGQTRVWPNSGQIVSKSGQTCPGNIGCHRLSNLFDSGRVVWPNHRQISVQNWPNAGQCWTIPGQLRPESGQVWSEEFRSIPGHTLADSGADSGPYFGRTPVSFRRSWNQLWPKPGRSGVKFGRFRAESGRIRSNPGSWSASSGQFCCVAPTWPPAPHRVERRSTALGGRTGEPGLWPREDGAAHGDGGAADPRCSHGAGVPLLAGRSCAMS